MERLITSIIVTFEKYTLLAVVVTILSIWALITMITDFKSWLNRYTCEGEKTHKWSKHSLGKFCLKCGITKRKFKENQKLKEDICQ